MKANLVLLLLGFSLLEVSPAVTTPPPANAEATTPRLTVAVLAFENRTGDPSLDYWRHAPYVHLHDVKAIRDAPGVDYALRQLNRKPTDPVDATVARQVGEWIEARRVIWGNYRRAGEKWVTSAYVMTVATGKTSGEITAAAKDWLEMRDQLAERLLKELGVVPTEAERRKLAKRPTSSAAAVEWATRALAFQAQDQPLPEIEHAIRQALQADPDFADAYLALASLAYSRGQKAEAETAARKAVQLKPDMGKPHAILGMLLREQDKFDDAEDELRTAARLDPDEAEIYSRLSELYRIQGWHTRAILNLDRARELDPFSADIHATLGLTYARNGQREKAIVVLREAARLASPDDVNAEQMMSSAYRALRDLPQAMEHAEKFIALGRRTGLNPPMVEEFEADLREMKSRLAVNYVTAARPKIYSPQSLRELLRAKLAPDEVPLVKDPLASTAEMGRWARELTQGATNEMQQAGSLYEALVRHLDPGTGGSRTAEEVFASWNTPQVAFRCQEYARLFVALARALGLQAFFALVDRDCNGERVIHACAAVFMGDRVLLVDPTYQWFGVPHKEFTMLDDLQAVACHLNQSSDLQRVRLAVKLQPDSIISRFNLVLGLMREDEWAEARRELPAALHLEPEGIWAKVARGQLALYEHQLPEATRLLEEAVAMMPMLASGHALLADAYLKQGRLREARAQYRIVLTLPQDKDCLECARSRIADINEKIGND